MDKQRREAIIKSDKAVEAPIIWGLNHNVVRRESRAAHPQTQAFDLLRQWMITMIVMIETANGNEEEHGGSRGV